jgi:hypothetical protein
MIPMRMSTIFKSRWMALIWAAGMIWFAYDIAGGSGETSNASANAEQPTDATGETITPEDAKKFNEALNGL